MWSLVLDRIGRADMQHLYTDGCFMYFNECVGRLNLAAQVDLVYID